MSNKKRKSNNETEAVSKYFPSPNKITKTENKNIYSKIDLKDFLENIQKLSFNDYNKKGLTLAQYLLGKILCRFDGNNILLCGRIVETEAYLGVEDKACHTYGNKKTERTRPMFMAAGTSYVYTIYGMYSCLNISTSDQGGCVLIRALQPINGMKEMRENRGKKRKEASPTLKEHQLCNGPSKLCQALNINKNNLNALDLTTNKTFFLVDDNKTLYKENEIIICKRIGIEGYGAETASLPYRFYVKGNKNVSKADKLVEKAMEQEDIA